MYSLSDRLLMLLPGVMAVFLALLVAVPMSVHGVPLTPNVAWLMTMIVAVLYPPAWSFWFAFALGLLQDVLGNTPLGAQALLALLLWLAMRLRVMQLPNPLFRMVWAQALLLMLVWHGLLWLVLGWVSPPAPRLPNMLLGALLGSLWFPLLYFPVMAMTALLPQGRE